MTEISFDGFDIPRSNYFKMPNVFIEFLPDLKGSEISCLIYILRHTWGYQEFGIKKRISINEFMKGRKKKGGERLDRGTGLSNRCIIDALVSLEKRGIIEVQYDTKDKARVKKYYSIKIRCEESSHHEESSYHAEESSHLAEESSYRTKKETKGNKQIERKDNDSGLIFKAYQDNIGLLTPILAEDIGDCIDEYPEGWIIEAIQIAVSANVRKWSYVKGVLHRWKNDGKHLDGEAKAEHDRRKYVEGKYADLIE